MRLLTQNKQLKFADVLLDLQTEQLSRDNEIVNLPHLSFLLLKTLAENSPQTLTQDELINAVWDNKVVGNETLKQRVKLLRKSLGDDASNPTYIAVERGRGYRLLPKVVIIMTNPSAAKLDIIYHERIPDLSSEQSRLLWKKVSLGFGLLLTIAIGSLFLVSQHYQFSSKLIEPTANSKQVFNWDSERSIHHYQAHEYFLKGVSYYQRYLKEDNRIAIEFFKHALKLDPNLADAYAGLADAYSQGVFQFDEPDKWRQLALDSAYNAVHLAPKSEIAYKALGLAEYLNGKLPEAIRANLKAVEIKPNYLQANTNLSFMYRELGQLDKAFEWNLKTITIDPFYAPGYLHLAQSYEAQGKLELAEINYLKALELKPDYQLAKDAYRIFIKEYKPSA